MKFKNRDGSTLALTLMVFAVLMIFATFIMGFMVTENKQAIRHQNKTQAYYIARSGAVAVEAAIRKELKLSVDFINTISIDKASPTKITFSNLDIDYKDAYVDVWRKENESENDNDINYTVFIHSKAVVANGITEDVWKEIDIDLSEELVTLDIDNPIEFIDYADIILINGYIHNENKHYPGLAVKINDINKINKLLDLVKFPSGFELYSNIISMNFDEFNFSNNATINAGNYYIDTPLNLASKNWTISGEVNLFVEDYVYLEDATSIKYDVNNKKSKLNIYIYGTNNEGYSIYFNTNKGDSNYGINADFHVLNGDTYIFLHKMPFYGSIFVDKGLINLMGQSNGNDVNFGGFFIAPNSIVSLGSIDGQAKANFIMDGAIISKEIYFKEADNKYSELTMTMSGITDKPTTGYSLKIRVIGTGKFVSGDKYE